MLSLDNGFVILISLACVLSVWWLARRFERSPWLAVTGLLPLAVYFPSPATALYGLGALTILLLSYGVLRLLLTCGKRAR